MRDQVGLPRRRASLWPAPAGARRGTKPRRDLPAGEPSYPPVAGWEPRYRTGVLLADLFSVLFGVLVVGGFVANRVDPASPLITPTGVVTFGVLVASLMVNRVWNLAILGQGAEEFRRLGRAFVAASVVLALGGLLFDITQIRPWVFIVVPATALLVFPMRYVLRQFLHRARREGRCLLPVMAAGNVETIRDLITRTRGATHLGWRVAAVCTTDGLGEDVTEIDGVPVVGQLRDLAAHARRGGYRIVAVTPDAYWTPKRLQQLAWKLEGSGAEMVVAPVLMEVAGPRLHVDAVLGMPLLRVSSPSFTGVRRVVKDVFDKVGAAILLTLLAPVMIAVSIAIAVDTRGPVFYKQRRVGKDGREFTIVKFRTMVVNAHKLVTKLADQNEGHGLLFKMRKDPRVTKVGAILRRYSIDELPQLFNVLAGPMSLVGPRPPLPEESARYAPDVRRRLLVKPGLTGLWQVSGRSDLPWEEAVRLDLRYVEDWSLALDAVILWKTFRAVFTGQGAY
ncbi:sugar transferase [Actinokineospora diospyrosa]|uniref:Exopolysaccharide biosynthesis polyprenyl glycosylphosphotransferase n=1 Tax=Actinokineospora diospyrosa TaxID=103728 RepID=A0ABT1IHZ7_9PSEU|nr:sugar transferase [Actinokineospora diospyrosa]MCP2272249.1 exopolysaccharide biosynthesis polyprenyl glycosylphosphotransferase [Actinokineospora diospyrosa]